MELGEIFEKPVDRGIEGVIKADSTDHLAVELDEYVVTEDIKKLFETFLDSYLERGASASWISGFFGSGKSHFLKILSLVLTNAPLPDGRLPLQILKSKLDDNAILAANLDKASRIPACNILFNIDQKAPLSSKEERGALLDVFIRVFNGARGYYEGQGYIANFEAQLDENGIFDAFKAAFQKVAGLPWELGRDQVILQEENIDAAWNLVKNQPEGTEKGILDKYRKDYSVSIEDFAQTVKRWLDRQKPGYRINFFVDEVGQFIAGNARLMLNLQTMAETLATVCRGRARLAVTAQEDLDKIVGAINRSPGNDFSKILARFQVQLPLHSKDVEEVIRKRLLAKNSAGAALLAPLYQASERSFPHIFNFSKEGRQWSVYHDEENFVQTWPFVPYQFALFQEALRGLSNNNAFQGRFHSIGERSMLAVFQEVTKRLARSPATRMATLDLMFDGLRQTMNSQIQSPIIQAEQAHIDPFSLKVLKTLFMAKYAQSYRTTSENIRVLMVESLHEPVEELVSRVDSALRDLLNQGYIRQERTTWQFLTNEEKSIDAEIRNMEIPIAFLTDALESLFFDEMLGLDKFRHPNGIVYSYARKIDGKILGKPQPLSVNLLSPWDGNTEGTLVKNPAEDDLLIDPPYDRRFVSELYLWARTDRYLKKQIIGEDANRDRLLSIRRDQNDLRWQQLLRDSVAIITNSPMYVGRDRRSPSGSGKNKVHNGLYQLVESVYFHFGMPYRTPPKHPYEEKELAKWLMPEDPVDPEEQLSEAQTEMLNQIKMINDRGVQMSLQNFITRMRSKPWGWPKATTLCLTADLYARDRLEFRLGTTYPKAEELPELLQDKDLAPNIILIRHAPYTPEEIRLLGELMTVMMHPEKPSTDSRPLLLQARETFRNLAVEIEEMLRQKASFPFLAKLEPWLARLHQANNQQPAWFMRELTKESGEWRTWYLSDMRRLRSFLKTRQRDIYLEIRNFLKENRDNFHWLDGNVGQELENVLQDNDCYCGNTIPGAKILMEKTRREIDAKLSAEREKILDALASLMEEFQKMPRFSALKEDDRAVLLQPFENLKKELHGMGHIDVLQNRLALFRHSILPGLCRQLEELSRPEKGIISDPTSLGQTSTPYGQTEIALAELLPLANGPLNSEAAASEWLERLSDNLLAQIRNGVRVIVG